MIRIYATFNGLKDLEPNKNSIFTGNLQMIWKDVVNDLGEPMNSVYHSNRTKLFNKMTLRRGNRYVIDCKEIKNNKILFPTNIINTRKNPTCTLIRNAFDDYTFIKGKYKGKWLKKMDRLEKVEIKRYLLYLGNNTNNEATTRNVLNMLKILKNEEI